MEETQDQLWRKNQSEKIGQTEQQLDLKEKQLEISFNLSRESDWEATLTLKEGKKQRGMNIREGIKKEIEVSNMSRGGL